MFSRISEVGSNRKLVPSNPRLSFWTVWFRHNQEKQVLVSKTQGECHLSVKFWPSVTCQLTRSRPLSVWARLPLLLLSFWYLIFLNTVLPSLNKRFFSDFFIHRGGLFLLFSKLSFLYDYTLETLTELNHTYMLWPAMKSDGKYKPHVFLFPFGTISLVILRISTIAIDKRFKGWFSVEKTT